MLFSTLDEHCRYCQQSTRFEVNEYWKGFFVIKPYPWTPNSERVLKKLGNIAREHTGWNFEKKFNRYVISTSRLESEELASALKKSGISVHTVREHAEIVCETHTSKRKLGKRKFVELASGVKWQYIDPKLHNWTYLNDLQEKYDYMDYKDRFLRNAKSTILRGGQVIRSINNSDKKYFIYFGRLEEIEKRAAENLAARYYEKRDGYWLTEEEDSGVGIIPLSSIGLIPEDIFISFQKLRPYDDWIDGHCLFDINDFDIVKKLAQIMNTRLVKVSKFLDVPAVNSLAGTVAANKRAWAVKKGIRPRNEVRKIRKMALIPLKAIEPDKLKRFTSIHEKIGVKVDHKPDHLQLNFEKSSIGVSFIVSEELKTIRLDSNLNVAYVPIDYLYDVSQIMKIMKAHAKKNGRKVNIKKLLAQEWTVESEGDLNFFFEVFFANIKDESFVKNIIKSPERKKVLKEWYNANNNPSCSASFNMLRTVGNLLGKRS